MANYILQIQPVENDQTAGKAPPVIPGAFDSLLRY